MPRTKAAPKRRGQRPRQPEAPSTGPATATDEVTLTHGSTGPPGAHKGAASECEEVIATQHVSRCADGDAATDLAATQDAATAPTGRKRKAEPSRRGGPCAVLRTAGRVLQGVAASRKGSTNPTALQAALQRFEELDADAQCISPALRAKARKVGSDGRATSSVSRPVTVALVPRRLVDEGGPSACFAALPLHTRAALRNGADAPLDPNADFREVSLARRAPSDASVAAGAHLELVAAADDVSASFAVVADEDVAAAVMHLASSGSGSFALCARADVAARAPQWARLHLGASEGDFCLLVGLSGPAVAQAAAVTDPEHRGVRAWNASVRTVVDASCPDAEDPPPPDSDAAAAEDEKLDAVSIFAAVRPAGDEEALPDHLHPESLRPTLRGYQRRAVAWMVKRERGIASLGDLPRDGLAATQREACDMLGTSGAGREREHPLWRRVECMPGGPHPALWVNRLTGLVALTEFRADWGVRGGAICEEMGLGKTVEVLACILAHRLVEGGVPKQPKAEEGGSLEENSDGPVDCVCGATDDANYAGLWIACDRCSRWMHSPCVDVEGRPPRTWHCPVCTEERAAECGRQLEGVSPATLIVVPAPLLPQWCEEIQRHTRGVQVRVFEGQGDDYSTSTTPADLSSSDIVLVTYETLRRELHRKPDSGDAAADSRSRRRRQRYAAFPTPLTRLTWWRVCLDEAQAVESTTAKAAQMALQIPAVHRWCVTGTPINRGLEDLQGLFAFLRVQPYDTPFWWRRAIQDGCEAGCRHARERLLALLRPASGGLLWRSSKASVAHELQLPGMQQLLSKLHLSAVERHFYNQQHRKLQSQARGLLPAWAARVPAQAGDEEDVVVVDGHEDRALSHKEADRLLRPLLLLRQACCHPQVGQSGLRAAGGANGALMSMDDVLAALIVRAKTEAEEAQRLLVAALNGLAAVALLEESNAGAVELYRESLRTIEQNKAHVRTDKLQRLHTLHNLHEVLTSVPGGVPGVPHTLRDATLAEEARELRQGYVAAAITNMRAAEAQYRDTSRKVAEGAAGREGWWLDAVDVLAARLPDGGYDAAQDIRTKLGEADQYWQTANSVSIASQITSLATLKLLLASAADAQWEARCRALRELDGLGELCGRDGGPPRELVSEAGQCKLCRADLGVEGVKCRHCGLDVLLRRWEGRLYTLQTRAVGGGAVDIDAALSHEEGVFEDRMERGGILGTNVRLAAGAVRGGTTARDAAVTRSNVVRHPSEVERALRLLLDHLRKAIGKHMGRVAAFGRVHDVQGMIDTAQEHLKAMELQRTEFLRARSLAKAQREALYACDEVDMCLMRIHLRGPHEIITQPIEALFKLLPSDVPVRKRELEMDRAAAEHDLGASLSTLRYLLTLQQAKKRRARREAGAAGDAAPRTQEPAGDKAQEAAGADGAGQGGEEGEVCPICQEALQLELAVMRCGHVLCTQCSLKWVERAGAAGGVAADRQIKCPVCRKKTRAGDIAYIDERARDAHTIDGAAAGPSGGTADLEATIVVAGSYGTKLEAVVRRILALTRRDPSCRIIVFSEWMGVLELVSHALTTNRVPHALARGGGKGLQDALRALRATPEDDAAPVAPDDSAAAPSVAQLHAQNAGATPARPRKAAHSTRASKRRRGGALPWSRGGRKGLRGAGGAAQVALLPLRVGANGLNITEAQHVVFVEPLLDPAVEAQAVGRVHRIGQTRETQVHRFVVEATVEEGVHAMARRRAAGQDLSAAGAGRRAEEKALTVVDVARLVFGHGAPGTGRHAE
ncbi:unnamed protein product [Pedinophyceae sp. YPF-701]|nr:unnamed protein product [Pedinophyceae sp. YPF-701]